MTNVRLARFEKEFKHVDMSSYYQLKNGPDEGVSIEKDVKEGSVYLTIRYKKKNECPSLDLPPELLSYISEYLNYYIEIKTKITYSPNYPFAPPVWFIQEVTHNIPGQFYMLDYYSYRVSQHNKSYNTYLLKMQDPYLYNEGWNPAISIDKDILSFIQKVNHFDEMLACAW
jgi:hypothetical protein